MCLRLENRKFDMQHHAYQYQSFCQKMEELKNFCIACDTKTYLLYNVIVQPYFDYCSPLWDNCGIGLKDRLQKFQNWAARVISGATYDVRSVDLLESLGWKHLELIRNYLKSVFMYKILNNHTAPNLRTSFRLNNECA